MSATNDDQIVPGFLIASPKLDGSPFERALVLMVQHDADGSMGYIVNKRVDVDFGELMTSVDDTIESRMCGAYREHDVYFGGPVRVGQLWLIHRSETAEDGYVAPGDPEGDIVFTDDWRVSASAETIEWVATQQTDAPIFPVLGYAGWGGGQLEEEIEEGSWLMCDFDEQLLVNDDPPSMWDAALEKTGVHPTAFLMMAKGESV